MRAGRYDDRRRGCRAARVALLLGLFALEPRTARAAPPDAPVTIDALLDELLDRDALAHWPEPAFVSRQESSRDRRSKSPQDATEGGWFANVDNLDGMGDELRFAKHGGRDECVLVDAEGPGALTRFWTGGKPPTGTLRFYFDDGEEPALAGAPLQLLSGLGPIPSPLALKTAGDALNLSLPLPFAKRLQVTYDEGSAPKAPPQRWFNAEWRRYADGTRVASFARGDLERLRARLAAVAQALAHPGDVAGDEPVEASGVLDAGDELALALVDGPRAIRTIEVRLQPEGREPDAAGAVAPRPLRERLREIVVVAAIDGEESIWCPASELFATGPTLVPLSTWTRTARDDGHLFLRFPMPYAKSARVALKNVGAAPMELSLALHGGGWRMDERTLRFHATWRREPALPTRPFSDWRFVEVAGRGVYVGDALSIANPSVEWWGEGDEKVRVDGEPFPSHFGTGTEDCYGFAWGRAEPFAAPFVAQPRVDGPGNSGITVVARTRALDAIPFAQSIAYDMEVWHWADCKVDLAAASLWYARPGATCDRLAPPGADSDAFHARDRELARFDPEQALPKRFRLAGAVEAETARVVAASAGLATGRQAGLAFASGRWSNDAQLFVQAKQPGDFVDLELAPSLPAARRVRVHLTKSFDYGILRLSLRAASPAAATTALPAPIDVDAFASASDVGLVADLGVVPSLPGALVLRVEVIGRNPASRGSGCFFGVDAIELAKE